MTRVLCVWQRAFAIQWIACDFPPLLNDNHFDEIVPGVRFIFTGFHLNLTPYRSRFSYRFMTILLLIEHNKQLNQTETQRNRTNIIQYQLMRNRENK